MSVTEWIICGGILAGLIFAAVYFCKGKPFRRCEHCPMRNRCMHPHDPEDPSP